MLQRVFLTVLIVSLAACGSLPVPEKPKVEMGIIDYPRGEIITNRLDTTKIESVKQLRYSSLVKAIMASKYKRVPIKEYDRAIALKPKSWEQIQNYIDKLEDYARNRCN